ncbi:unnamed protein product, partial [Rotaria sp. Silwood2]
EIILSHTSDGVNDRTNLNSVIDKETSSIINDFIKPSIPTKQYQPLDFILKLQSSLTNVEYPPKTRLIYGTNDITDLP